MPRRPPAAPVLGASRGALLADTWQDLRYGLRTLRRNPLFAFLAILTLTLSLSLTQQLNANASIPAETKQQAQVIIDQGVEIVSDAHIQENITSLDPVLADEILSIYDTARTNAFRIAMLAVAASSDRTSSRFTTAICVVSFPA